MFMVYGRPSVDLSSGSLRNDLSLATSSLHSAQDDRPETRGLARFGLDVGFKLGFGGSS